MFGLKRVREGRERDLQRVIFANISVFWMVRTETNTLMSKNNVSRKYQIKEKYLNNNIDMLVVMSPGILK